MGNDKGMGLPNRKIPISSNIWFQNTSPLIRVDIHLPKGWASECHKDALFIKDRKSFSSFKFVESGAVLIVISLHMGSVWHSDVSLLRFGDH